MDTPLPYSSRITKRSSTRSIDAPLRSRPVNQTILPGKERLDQSGEFVIGVSGDYPIAGNKTARIGGHCAAAPPCPPRTRSPSPEGGRPLTTPAMLRVADTP